MIKIQYPLSRYYIFHIIKIQCGEINCLTRVAHTTDDDNNSQKPCPTTIK